VTPLSPLLFVLATDFLQSIVNKAWHMGILKHPISEDFVGDFSIVQYADDTLLILPATASILFNLKGLLRSFSDSSGLHVNFSKSFLVPINVTKEKSKHLANTFACEVGKIPFTYLGLPLSITRPTVADYWSLVSKCERRLTGISSFLSQAGRASNDKCCSQCLTHIHNVHLPSPKNSHKTD